MEAETATQDEPAFPSEADIDAVLYEFDGDPRAAIHALLTDLDKLARDANDSVSKGYVRGRRFTIVIGDRQ